MQIPLTFLFKTLRYNIFFHNIFQMFACTIWAFSNLIVSLIIFFSRFMNGSCTKIASKIFTQSKSILEVFTIKKIYNPSFTPFLELLTRANKFHVL